MKPSRVSLPPSETGLLAWLENTRVSLPLKSVECDFTVTGALACVQLDQIYHQDNARPLDCTYTFPLPAGAAVYRCELHVNGRVIRAKVEEEAQARRIFKQQKEAGFRAALVEAARENVFTLALGNVQPGDLIVVRLAWFQMLDRHDAGLRLRVPTCPGVRYIPGTPLLRRPRGRGVANDTDQVPDASRLTPPRIDALHPDAAYFYIAGQLAAADVASASVSSPTHAVFLREDAGAITLELSTRGAVPDRDFVLAWREAATRQLAPRSWRWSEAGATYALVELRAPAVVEAADAFSQDFYFLVDRSGSMRGAKWQCTCQALRAFVGLLGPQDRVWITLFESSFVDFAEAPLPAPQVLADRGFQNMEALGAAGGTALQPAATHVLERIGTHSAGRPTSVVLITDGQVGNDAAIVQAFRKFPHVRVHTFGIDTAVNDAFLRALARQQRGGCWLQTPNDDIAGTIAALGHRLRRPVLTDLTLGRGWQAGDDRLPDLCAQEIVTIALRSEGAAPLKITGKLPNGQPHRLAIPAETLGSEATKLLWAKERIEALLEAGHSAEAIALAREYNLVCRGAAFIAWDEAECVQIAREEIVQPALEVAELHRGRIVAQLDALTSGPALSRYAIRAKLNPPDAAPPPPPSAGSAPAPKPSDAVSADVEKLRPLLERIGFDYVKFDALRLWVKKHGAAAARKLGAFYTSMERHPVAIPVNRPGLRQRWEVSVRQVLQGSPAELLEWPEKFGQPFTTLLNLVAHWTDAGLPEELIEALISAVASECSIDTVLLQKLEKVRQPARAHHFSADAASRAWREAIKAALGADSQAYATAVRVLPLGSDAVV